MLVAEMGRSMLRPYIFCGEIFARGGVDFGKDGIDFGAVGGERADRVGCCGVSREQQSLAAAASEVDGAAIAGVAGGLHPSFAPEFLKGIARIPDFGKALVLHVGELQAGDDFGGMTGESFAAGRDQH